MTEQPYAVALVKPGRQDADLLLAAGTSNEPIPFPTFTLDQAVSLLDSMTTIPGNPPYRVYVRTSGPQQALLIVGTPVDDVEQGLRSLAIGLIGGVLTITLLGALAAWLLVRRFFRPVDEMVAAAIGIAGGNTELRVPSAAPGTELGELSQALNRMIESLTSALVVVGDSEERLRAFVSDASHEIRTPLTVIRGYVELLQGEREDMTELEQRALERIASESRRLESLVTQLLLLERIDRGTGDIAVFDLGDLAREYLGDLAHLDVERRIDWQVEAAEIHGNADLWRQALANIAQNLQRHTPPGSPIQVLVTSDVASATLIVDDAGPGIPVSRRASVVQRFTRLDDSRSSATGGFGLGMSVIAAVVQQHGGGLELLDSPLGGLRMRITVPR